MSCPNCFTGHVNPDTPRGRTQTIHGRPAYVAEPSKGKPAKGLLVIVSDAFGWEFVNNRILADHYADASGFTVYLPDFMDGNAAPLFMLYSLNTVFDSASTYLSKAYNLFWVVTAIVPYAYRNRPAVSNPRVTSFFEALRENEGANVPIGVAGFCWGGRHAIRLTQSMNAPNGKPLVDVAFTAHPSALSIPGDIEKVAKPLSIAIGDKDVVLPMKQVEQVKQVFAGKDSVDTELKIYPGAAHGFGVRAAPDRKESVRQAAEAEEQAVAWFKKYMVALS